MRKIKIKRIISFVLLLFMSIALFQASTYADAAVGGPPVYRVDHYKQSLDNPDDYQLADSETQDAVEINNVWMTDAQPKMYEGFLPNPFEQKEVIVSDAQFVVEIFYDRAKLTIRFDGNGATSGNMADQEFVYGEPKKPLNQNAYKRDGFTFDCWNWQADGTGFDVQDMEDFWMTKEDVNIGTLTLYAQWKPDPVTHLVITKWVDKDTGQDLKKPSQPAADPLEPGTIPDYTYVNSQKDADGNVTHYFMKNMPMEVITEWIDMETGDKLKDFVQATDIQPAGSFDGYVYVKSVSDDAGNTTHFFQKEVNTPTTTTATATTTSTSAPTAVTTATNTSASSTMSTPKTGESVTMVIGLGLALIAVIVLIIVRKKIAKR